MNAKHHHLSRYRYGMLILLVLTAVLLRMPASAEPGTLQDQPADSEPVAETTSTSSETDSTSGESAIARRTRQEKRTGEFPFVITPHKPNYVLPLSYNTTTHSEPFSERDGDIDGTEVKFQISLKYQLMENLFQSGTDLYIAYTNLSFWQAYNKDASSPFRETSHEPEAWLSVDTGWTFGSVTCTRILVGAVHQSNGRGGSLSRSWNRLYMNFIFEAGDVYFSVKPWYRLPEDEKTGPDDPTGDDNPDIDAYMGYGELGILYQHGAHNFAMTLRNNLRSSGNRGAVELGWSFPLFKRLRGYVQYFNGYGESLIDYNASTNRFGAGLLLTDFL